MANKYSNALKIQVAKEYLEGFLGIRGVAKKYGIKSKSAVDRWVKLYEKFGEKGLISKKHKETYPVQFKLDVLRFIERTGSSETETALHFAITNPTLISQGKKEFRKGGAGVQRRPKGLTPMSNTS